MKRIIASILIAFAASTVSFAQETFDGGPEIIRPSGPPLLERSMSTVCDGMEQSYCVYPGVFVGLGGSVNSVQLDQRNSGVATAEVFSDSTLVASGDAGGAAPVYHATLNTLAPVAQAGFFRNFSSDWSWGSKFTYKYLGLTFTNPDVFSAQPSTLIPTGPDTFLGRTIAQSSQFTINHQMTLMYFLSHSFDRGRVYLGGGPVVFYTVQRINQLTSYADVNGVHSDVTGTPVNLTGSNWMWGGGAQIGANYYLGPSCFLDVSYDIVATGWYSKNFTAPFTSDSGGFTETGTLNVTTSNRLTAQSFMLTFNTIF